MTDEEKNETTEETPEPEAPEETPEPEAPEETPEPEAPEAAPAEEAEAPADEPEAEEAPPEVLSPKEQRRRARSLHTGEARPSRSVEERTAERVERRRKKAEERRRWRSRSREKRKATRGPREGTPPVGHTGTGSARERLGVVVSDKADKTITVRIDIARQHRTYGKIVRTSSTLHAHDERNEASAGDTVRVIESRPLSRTKRWRLVEILEKAR